MLQTILSSGPTRARVRPLRLGFWAIEWTPQHQRAFTTTPEEVDYLQRLLGLFLAHTDFELVLPVGASTAWDALREKHPQRITVIREEKTDPLKWPEAAIQQPCDCWLCPTVRFRNSILGLGQLTSEEIVHRFEVFEARELGPCLNSVNFIMASLARLRGVPGNLAVWTDEQTRLLKLFRHAAQLPEPQKDTSPRPKQVTLFLSQLYQEGVWELLRHLLTALVELNRERQQLQLTLLVVPGQNLSGLDQLEGLQTDTFDWELISLPAAIWELGEAFQPLLEGPQFYTLPKALNKEVPAPDALFALCDRITLPLLMRVPYGVWIYDLIQENAPEAFDEQFKRLYRLAMKPTLAKTQVAVVPSECVRAEAEAAYRLNLKRFVVIPVACEPHKRFGRLEPKPVPAVNRPYFLYPANAAPHKGAEIVLRAYAQYKAMQKEAPLLVQCGFHSEKFSQNYAGPHGSAHSRKMQSLISELHLIEGQDVLFLGNVTEAELLSLYQGAIAVLNAAKFDNGSFNMVEGHYFGKPVVSSDYPGARELAKRFDLPVRFYPLDNFVALARELIAVQKLAPLNEAELLNVRQKLTAAEYSVQTQAERFYRVLLDLTNPR